MAQNTPGTSFLQWVLPLAYNVQAEDLHEHSACEES
jgi:hypothetical protein